MQANHFVKMVAWSFGFTIMFPMKIFSYLFITWKFVLLFNAFKNFKKYYCGIRVSHGGLVGEKGLLLVNSRPVVQKTIDLLPSESVSDNRT